MGWSFVATDLNGVVLGEFTNAFERKVVLPHMRVPTANFKIPIEHWLVPRLLTQDLLLKCYRFDPASGTNDLIFFGPIVTIEESGDAESQTVACSAVGPYWRLSKRLVGLTAAGFSSGVPLGDVDLGQIAFNILAECNNLSYTGIAQGSLGLTQNGGVGPWWFKKAADGIAEISAGLNSFEFLVRPTEITASAAGTDGTTWPRIAIMDIAPTIGSNRPNAIFEYGTPRGNVASYTHTVDSSDRMTVGIISVQGWPDAPLDGASPLTAGLFDGLVGRFEDVVDDAGVSNDTLRGALLNYAMSVRAAPRQVAVFTLATNARPQPFVDYAPGDTVRGRALVRGSVRFDASFRIWGITVSIDSNGNEDTELELVMPS